jgi:methionyl-tRNA synthetase
MPHTAQAVWQRIGMAGDVAEQQLPNSVSWGQYPAGNTVEKGDPLFPRKSK